MHYIEDISIYIQGGLPLYEGLASGLKLLPRHPDYIPQEMSTPGIYRIKIRVKREGSDQVFTTYGDIEVK